MTAIDARQKVLITLILAGALFALVAWTQQPDSAGLWFFGALSVPLAWGVLVLFGAMPGAAQPEARHHIYNSLIGAALLVTGALGMVMAVALDAVPEDWSTRFGMLSSALVLIVIGNALPKKIERGCTRTRSLRIQRLLGWTFVITGLIAIPIALLTPMGYARVAALSLYALATIFVVWSLARIKRRPASAKAGS